MKTITNKERAEFANQTLRAYEKIRGFTDEQELVICDLLTDLAHLANSKGLSFDDLLERAQDHYHEELEG